MRSRLAVAAILLIAGAFPYIFIRQDAVFMSAFLTLLPEPLELPDRWWSHILLYNFPDAAWYGALLCTIHAIPSKDIPSSYVAKISLLLPFILEFMQLSDVIPGTFDLSDIMSYVITLITYKSCVQNEYQKPSVSSS